MNDGSVSVQVYWDDATGNVTRVTTHNTTGAQVTVHVAMADGSRAITRVIQTGDNEYPVPPGQQNQIARAGMQFDIVFQP